MTESTETPVPDDVSSGTTEDTSASAENPLVAHARGELTLMGEDQVFIDQVCAVVRAFADMGHSGTSAEFTLQYLEDLLRWRNLKPLTNSPDEWQDRTTENGGTGLWQNKRNPEAFSKDGGKTYYLLSENNMPHTAHDAPNV